MLHEDVDTIITTTTMGRYDFTKHVNAAALDPTRIVAFQRSGDTMAALVSIDLLRFVAGEPLDEATCERMQAAAKRILSCSPAP